MPIQSKMTELSGANDALCIRFLVNTWGQDPLKWYPSTNHPFSDPNPTHWLAGTLGHLVGLANAAGPARRTEAVDLLAEIITKRIDKELERIQEWHKATRKSNTTPQQSTEQIAPSSKEKGNEKKPSDQTKDDVPPPEPATYPLPSDILAATTTLILRSDDANKTENESSTRFPTPPPPRRIKALKQGDQGTLLWAKAVETARQESAAVVREAGGEQKMVVELKTKGALLDKLIEENRALRESAGPLKLEVFKLKERVGELETNERKRKAEEELKCEGRKRVRMEAKAREDVVVLEDDDDDDV